jgi:hypothetical protein
MNTITASGCGHQAKGPFHDLLSGATSRNGAGNRGILYAIPRCPLRWCDEELRKVSWILGVHSRSANNAGGNIRSGSRRASLPDVVASRNWRAGVSSMVAPSPSAVRIPIGAPAGHSCARNYKPAGKFNQPSALTLMLLTRAATAGAHRPR